MQLLNDVDMYSLLPETYQNVYTKCISYALNQAIRLLIKYSNRIGVIYAVEQLPESVLDQLAIEYSIKFYKQDEDLKRKQRLIKNALINYMTAGTEKDLENTIANIYASAQVKEWFDYGGEPYHFKVTATGVNTNNENSVRDFFDVIEATKNVRSVLDGVQVRYSLNAGLIHSSKIVRNTVKTSVQPYDREFSSDLIDGLKQEE